MRAAITANLTVLAIFAIGAAAYVTDGDLYYALAQEDRLLEWLTFWLFVAAAYSFFQYAAGDRRRRGGLPWFAVGLGMFCSFVALEEISWGQRLVGYQPPDYFLEKNFQQEFNLHNVVDTDLRMLGMHVVLIGYGVVLGLLATLPALAARLAAWRIVPPPAWLAPGFFVIAVVYAWYPARFTGEWVEAATGAAFLGAGVAALSGSEAESTPNAAIRTMASVAAAVATLGVLTLAHGSDATRTAAAEAETQALAADFSGPRVATRCGIHKRLYTFMREYNQPYLVEGAFAERVRTGGDASRADYLLDPWNSPYWIRHKCTGGRAVAFVYSFGPNRRRDSSQWEIGGDDVGTYLLRD